MEMITTQLTKYAKALNNLPEEIKNKYINMVSTEAPTDDTIVSHEGLVSIVAQYLPELKECYNRLIKQEGIQEYITAEQNYSYEIWEDALDEYLGFSSNKVNDSLSLLGWATDNPDIWNGKYGYQMFISGKAFGQETDFFPVRVIIDHFTVMSEKLNKEEYE